MTGLLLVAVIVAWTLSFSAVNYGAKDLMDSLPESGPGAIARHVLVSGWTYAIPVLYVTCAIFYLVAIKLLPLSVAGPMFLVIGIMATTLIGAVLYRESFSLVKAVGLATCLAGSLILFSQR